MKNFIFYNEYLLILKNFGYYIEDLNKRKVDYPIDFIQFMKKHGYKLTKNKDLIEYISKMIQLPNEIDDRQNEKANKLLKNTVIHSLSIKYPEEMKVILSTFMKDNCNIKEEEENKIREEINKYINQVQNRKDNNEEDNNQKDNNQEDNDHIVIFKSLNNIDNDFHENHYHETNNHEDNNHEDNNHEDNNEIVIFNFQDELNNIDNDFPDLMESPIHFYDEYGNNYYYY